MNPQFRNTDLEIVALVEPKQMISELGDAIIVLHSTPIASGHIIAIETSTEHSSAEAAIDEFKFLFSRFSPVAISEWAAAIKKEFNFGYDIRSDSNTNEIHLPHSVVLTLAELKASIGFTLYNTAEQGAAANP